mgnify:CR=1 FL=1
MATGGTSVSGRRKGTIFLARDTDGVRMAAAGISKSYLIGADTDVGYTFDTPVRITRLSWQVSSQTADAGATVTINVSKGTEATVVYTSGALDIASDATVETGSDTTAASEALSNFSTSDDLIVVADFASLATAECDICVQVDFEYAD